MLMARAPDPSKARLHPLLAGVEGAFRRTRKIGEHEFLRPYKQLLPDVIASEVCLLDALNLASEVYSALNKRGYRVMLAPPDKQMRRPEIEEREVPTKDRKYGQYSMGRIWSPYRPTLAYFGTVPIGFALTEMSERVTLRRVADKYVREDSLELKTIKPSLLIHSWTTEQDVPSGRFRLVAYSPLRGVQWTLSWQDTGKSKIKGKLPEIIKALEASVDQIQNLMAEAEAAAARRERDWEAQREKWRREEDQRRVDDALAASMKQLSEIMEIWSKATAVHRFFRDAEECVSLLEGDRQKVLSERLALAKSMIGTLDPLEHLEAWLAPEERYTSQFGKEET